MNSELSTWRPSSVSGAAAKPPIQRYWLLESLSLRTASSVALVMTKMALSRYWAGTP